MTGADWERLGADAESLAHFVGNRAFMRMREGHCAALEVRPATGAFVCSIYERRPQICRDLARGSPECEAERILKVDVARSSPTGESAARENNCDGMANR